MSKAALFLVTIVCVFSQEIFAADIIQQVQPQKPQESQVSPEGLFDFLGQADTLKNITQKLTGDNQQVSFIMKRRKLLFLKL